MRVESALDRGSRSRRAEIVSSVFAGDEGRDAVDQVGPDPSLIRERSSAARGANLRILGDAGNEAAPRIDDAELRAVGHARFRHEPLASQRDTRRERQRETVRAIVARSSDTEQPGEGQHGRAYVDERAVAKRKAAGDRGDVVGEVAMRDDPAVDDRKRGLVDAAADGHCAPRNGPAWPKKQVAAYDDHVAVHRAQNGHVTA